MNNAYRICFTLIFAFVFGIRSAGADPVNLKLMVGKEERQALVFLPTAPEPPSKPPVVLLFHAHAGTAQQMAERLDISSAWPEALVVSLEGLPSSGLYADLRGSQSGWQFTKGQSEDRDLKFFDALVSKLEEQYHIDRKRLYVVGGSNGGFFCYLLWSERADSLSAVVAGACKLLPEVKPTKPLPALHFAGENDMRVLFREQQETIEQIRKLNGCSDRGKRNAEGALVYPSKSGTPLTVFTDSSTNLYSDGAIKATIAFLKERAAQPAGQDAPAGSTR